MRVILNSLSVLIPRKYPL